MPESSAVELSAVELSAVAAAVAQPAFGVQDTEDASVVQPLGSTLPPSRSTVSAVLALPPVRFLGQLLNQHPTIFWSGIWAITLLCAGIAVTGLMNPDLSSQQEQSDPTGVEAVLRATRLDQRKPASPAVSFGLLAVSCAGFCLLLSRRFQPSQSLSQPIRKKRRSPAKSTIAAELEAIATLASDATPDPALSLPRPSRQPWIDAALSAVQANSSSTSPASHTADSQAPPAPPVPLAVDYLSYLRVHAQSRAQSQRATRTEGRSPARPPNPKNQSNPLSLPVIAPYAPNPPLPVAFLSPPENSFPQNAFSTAAIAQPALPSATQPPLNLSQPPQPQIEALPDPTPTLAELRKIQAKRARKETEP